MAVVEDRRRVRDRQRAAAGIALNGQNRAKVFNLRAQRQSAGTAHGTLAGAYQTCEHCEGGSETESRASSKGPKSVADLKPQEDHNEQG